MIQSGEQKYCLKKWLRSDNSFVLVIPEFYPFKSRINDDLIAYNLPSENQGLISVEIVMSTSLGNTEEYPVNVKVNP